MKKVWNKIVLCFFLLSSMLPAWVHYRLSDCLYPLIYYIVRYRRTTVRRNLTASFPEKSETEISRIERSFYRFFCDYIVECCMYLSMSPEEIRRRMRFVGMEEIEKDVDRCGRVILFLGHYGNWEYISSIPLWTRPETKAAHLYRPLNNEALDRVFFQIRNHFDCENIAKNNALRRILEMRRNGEKVIIGFIADQSPRPQNIHDRVAFLHQDTPVFTGAERIAKKTGAAVYYGDMRRVKRGYYECHLIPMTNTPTEVPDFQLTHRYMQLLETSIRRQPELWLWSHKRWKHSRGAV